MTTNEVKAVVPEAVTDFLANYHQQSDQLSKSLRKCEDQEAYIATLQDQINSYRKTIEEVSAKSDYYMRLAVEMRTHFKAMSAMCNEADKCFQTGPYRNNGAVAKEALQIVADDINDNVECKEIPGFLMDNERKERLEDLKGEPVSNGKPEPKMPKSKNGWPNK